MASLGYTVNSRPDVQNKGLFGGWRNGLMLTVLAALAGHRFNSQHPCGGLQTICYSSSMGSSTLFLVLQPYQTYIWCVYIHETSTNKIVSKSKETLFQCINHTLIHIPKLKDLFWLSKFAH